MYACLPKICCGFFERVRALAACALESSDPPHPARKTTGASLPGLRPEVDHAPRYRGRGYSLG
jgi:hypothetical protein